MRLDNPSAPTLSSLPDELLSHITSYLDKASAISLSLVARKFAAFCDATIWATISLCLPPHYGELPLIQLVPVGPTMEYNTWAQEDARALSARRGEGVKAKAKDIMVGAGSRRLGMVRAIKFMPLPTANIAILQLLDILSPTPTSVELESPPTDPRYTPPSHELFDYHIISSSLSFPFLTHLRLNKHSVRHIEILWVLLRASPELCDLQADADYHTPHPSWDSEDDQMVHDFPAIPEKTKLRRLRCAFRPRNGEDGGHHPLVDLVRHSPSLEQVSVRYSGNADRLLPLIDALAQLERLEDLHLPHSVFEFRSSMLRASSGFMRLKRLALDMNSEFSVLEDLPSDLPFLETIHIDSDVAEKKELFAHTRFPETQPLTSMIPYACTTYRTCPRLANIYTSPVPWADLDLDVFAHFDAIEASGQTQTGFIRSLRHGEEEVYHTRYFMHFAEISDGDPGVVDDEPFGRDIETIFYTARDGSDREKVLERRPEAFFQESTDYGGLMVPLDVLREMRRVDKAPFGSWEGRGIEVGDEAWKVLTDWKEGREKELAAEKAKTAT